MLTGVEPSAASSVPAPMLMSMICTTWSRGATDLSRATTRAMAPVSCISVTCQMEVATTIATGRDASTPEKLASRAVCRGVLKNTSATRTVTTQPMTPAVSAAIRRQVSSRKMMMTGASASSTSPRSMIASAQVRI
jgi:hypothetical protein